MQEGRHIWVDMPIAVNGHNTVIKAYGQMGAIILNGQIVLLDEPFVELTKIDFGMPEDSSEQNVASDASDL